MIAGQEANFEQMKHLLMRIGINGEKVFSVNIFLIPEFDFEKYVELMNKKSKYFIKSLLGRFYISYVASRIFITFY